MTDDGIAPEALAAAVTDAADVPRHLLKGQRLGVCRRCGHRFDWGNGAGRGEFDPCPECGSPAWSRHGYRDGAVFVVGDAEPTL
ncbi:MAG: hypothetical protein ABEJ79_12475 [Halolamina sp.]